MLRKFPFFLTKPRYWLFAGSPNHSAGINEIAGGLGIEPSFVMCCFCDTFELLMSQSAVIHARIDQATKTATEEVLEALGMTPTEAIRLFYRQIAIRKSFPLELRVPSKLTASVMSKSDKNLGIERFHSAAELYASWDE